MIETIIEPLRSLDWEETDAVEAATVKALAMLTSQRADAPRHPAGPPRAA